MEFRMFLPILLPEDKKWAEASGLYTKYEDLLLQIKEFSGGQNHEKREDIYLIGE